MAKTHSWPLLLAMLQTVQPISCASMSLAYQLAHEKYTYACRYVFAVRVFAVGHTALCNSIAQMSHATR